MNAVTYNKYPNLRYFLIEQEEEAILSNANSDLVSTPWRIIYTSRNSSHLSPTTLPTFELRNGTHSSKRKSRIFSFSFFIFYGQSVG
jgi:hypothetical protein